MDGWRTAKTIFYLSSLVAVVYAVAQVVDPMLTFATSIKPLRRGDRSVEMTGESLADLTERLTSPGVGDRTGGGLPATYDSLVDSARSSAMEADDSAQRLAPEERQTLLESAESLHAQGKLAEAIVAYHNALARNPDDGGAHLNLAIAYFQQGDYNGAWLEVHEAQRLGKPPKPEFIETLRERMPDPGER